MIPSTAMNPMRVGLIGCGRIAQNKHIPAILSCPTLKLSAICSRSARSLDTAREMIGSRELFVTNESDALLARDDLDAVCICLPHRLHAPAAVAALNAGKHVLCEKPMACRLEDAERMLRAAEENGRVLSVAYQHRFSEPARKLKSLCEQSVFGRLYHIDAVYMRQRGVPSWGEFCTGSPEEGGSLLDIGSHVLDLMLYLSGEKEPMSVLGKTYSYIGKAGSRCNRWGTWPQPFLSDDSAFAMLSFPDGLSCHLQVAWASNIPEKEIFQLRFLGTEAGAVLEKDRLTLIREAEEGMACTVLVDQAEVPVSPLAPTCREWESFRADILAQRQGNAAEALLTARIIDDIRRSSLSGLPVVYQEQSRQTQA